MKYHLLNLIGSLLLLAFSAQHCLAKQWRNIIPLRTTRADVLRLLGSPKYSQAENREYFDLEDKVVTFTWVHQTCETDSYIVDERSIQPDDLVLQLTVKPKTPIPPKDFELTQPKTQIDVTKIYADAGDVDCIGTSKDKMDICTFSKGREGFGYSMSKAGITYLYYFPTDTEAEAWDKEHKACRPGDEKGK